MVLDPLQSVDNLLLLDLNTLDNFHQTPTICGQTKEQTYFKNAIVFSKLRTLELGLDNVYPVFNHNN